jgi:recombinational DNA repair protein (RecF pathway)
MTQDETPKTTPRACCLCGEEATRVIFSHLGNWKLCDKPACWNELTGKYPETEVTWLARPLPKTTSPPKA